MKSGGNKLHAKYGITYRGTNLTTGKKLRGKYFDFFKRLEKFKNQVKQSREIFISFQVCSPVLAETNRLSFIGEYNTWLTDEDSYFTKAAKLMGRYLTNDLINSSNQEAQDQFFDVFKKFKDRVSDDEKWQELTVLQGLERNEIMNGKVGDSDAWWPRW